MNHSKLLKVRGKKTNKKTKGKKMKKLLTITLMILCCYLITTQKTNAQKKTTQKQQTKSLKQINEEINKNQKNIKKEPTKKTQIQPKNKFTPIHVKPHAPSEAYTDEISILHMISHPQKKQTVNELNYINDKLKKENETIKQYEKRTLKYEKKTFEYHLDMITFLDTEQSKRPQKTTNKNNEDWFNNPKSIKQYTTKDFIKKFTRTPELNSLRPEFNNPNLPKIKIDEIKKIPLDATKEEIEKYKTLLSNEFENMHKKQKTLENHNKKLNEFIENIEEYMYDYDRFHKGKPIKQ
jgi:hypothetical protein